MAHIQSGLNGQNEYDIRELWIVRNGSVKSYDGDMESYRELLLQQRSTGRRARGGDKSQGGGLGGQPVDRQDQRRLAAERRAELAPLKKLVQEAEKTMANLADDIAKLDKTLADQGLYTRDPALAKKLAYDRGRLAKDLTRAEDTWLAATEAYEAAGVGG